MSHKISIAERQRAARRQSWRNVALAAAGLTCGLVMAWVATDAVSRSANFELASADAGATGQPIDLAIGEEFSRSAAISQPRLLSDKSALTIDEERLTAALARQAERAQQRAAAQIEQPLLYEEPNALTNRVDEAIAALPPARTTPWQSAPRGQALLSIIIDDIGPSFQNSLNAIDVPYPMTMAVLPYADGVERLVARAQANNHEIMLHLPMEPLGRANPGPNALLADLSVEEFDRRLDWALDRVPGYTGVNNHMGSRLTSQVEPMARVMRAIQERDVFFVDSRTTGSSVAAKIAATAGLDHATRDVFLDNVPEVGAIIEQLELAARIAQRRGSAIAIAHPYPATIAALRAWLPEAAARGIALAPVADVIAFRDCLAGGNSACVSVAAVRP